MGNEHIDEPSKAIDPVVLSAYNKIFGTVKLEEWQREMIDKMEFVLVGYDPEGQKVDRAHGIKQIIEIEKELVIDPHEIQKDLAVIAAAEPQEREKMSMTSPSFSTEGRHSHVNTLATLYRIRYEGWQIIAGLQSDDGDVIPIGANYGLSKMPEGYSEGDHEFASVDYGTLALGTQARRLDAVVPHNTAVNWRTSVLPSIPAEHLRQTITSLPADITNIPTRRLGIASALKFVMTHVVDHWKRGVLSYNIGTIYQPAENSKTEKSIRLRNFASYEHNKNLLAGEQIGEGYREYATPVQIQENDDLTSGHRHFVGKILWFARQTPVQEVQNNLTSPKSPLINRAWPLEKLIRAAERMKHQLTAEIVRGDHTH